MQTESGPFGFVRVIVGAIAARFDAFADWFVDRFTAFASNRYAFFLVILCTLTWMATQFFVKHSIDPVSQFFPLTVLLYTLYGLWIENAMKVQQARQQAADQRQLDHLEAMAEEAARRDQVIQALIETLELSVRALDDHTTRCSGERHP